jgi:hypothetical protein
MHHRTGGGILKNIRVRSAEKYRSSKGATLLQRGRQAESNSCAHGVKFLFISFSDYVKRRLAGFAIRTMLRAVLHYRQAGRKTRATNYVQPGPWASENCLLRGIEALLRSGKTPASRSALPLPQNYWPRRVDSHFQGRTSRPSRQKNAIERYSWSPGYIPGPRPDGFPAVKTSGHEAIPCFLPTTLLFSNRIIRCCISAKDSRS